MANVGVLPRFLALVETETTLSIKACLQVWQPYGKQYGTSMASSDCEMVKRQANRLAWFLLWYGMSMATMG